MKVGQAIQNLMQNEGVTGEQMAMDLHLDATMISKIKNNHRNMQKDVAAESIKIYPNIQYNMEVTREFSDGLTAPKFNGSAIESTNRLAVMIGAIKETKEALESINLERFIKHPDLADDSDLRAAETVFKECKEAEWSLANLCATIADAYYLPVKKMSNDLTMKWKATQYITKETT